MRYYHPTLGRFLTRDSLVPDATNGQDWNAYAYVRNDPWNWVDPTGHTAWKGCSLLPGRADSCTRADFRTWWGSDDGDDFRRFARRGATNVGQAAIYGPGDTLVGLATDPLGTAQGVLTAPSRALWDLGLGAVCGNPEQLADGVTGYAGFVAGGGALYNRAVAGQSRSSVGSIGPERQLSLYRMEGTHSVGRSTVGAAERTSRVTALIDPQLDANILIRLLRRDPDVVAFAQTNRAAGLSYNISTRAEFLGRGTRAQLRLLEERYDIRLIREVTPTQINAVAQRLQQAFDGTGRILRSGDARVAATAYLKGERLATSDLQFYKRALDLGLNVEFVGTGRAAARAAAYRPEPVTIPSP